MKTFLTYFFSGYPMLLSCITFYKEEATLSALLLYMLLSGISLRAAYLILTDGVIE